MPEAAVLSRAEQGSEGMCQQSWQPAVRQYPVSVWWHDFFNIVALGAINAANFWFLLYQTGFYRFWWASVVYFVVDFAWIVLDPSCVKSPYVLAAHHVVAAVYTLLPFFYPSTASKMSFVMTVEVRISGQDVLTGSTAAAGDADHNIAITQIPACLCGKLKCNHTVPVRWLVCRLNADVTSPCR
jgi:hypothetical protein